MNKRQLKKENKKTLEFFVNSITSQIEGNFFVMYESDNRVYFKVDNLAGFLFTIQLPRFDLSQKSVQFFGHHILIQDKIKYTTAILKAQTLTKFIEKIKEAQLNPFLFLTEEKTIKDQFLCYVSMIESVFDYPKHLDTLAKIPDTTNLPIAIMLKLTSQQQQQLITLEQRLREFEKEVKKEAKYEIAQNYKNLKKWLKNNGFEMFSTQLFVYQDMVHLNENPINNDYEVRVTNSKGYYIDLPLIDIKCDGKERNFLTAHLRNLNE